jgi:diaminopimelate decarboxylase
MISLRPVQSLIDQPTPHVVFDDGHFAEAITRAVEAASRRGLTLAYSVKTNPSAAALRVACAAGAFAEATNLAEVKRALSFGWPMDRVILNGPAKMWPSGDIPDGLLAVMCDSMAEFDERARGRGSRCRLGLRLRPSGTESRFGVDLADEEVVAELAERLRATTRDTLALHLHFNSTVIGVERWCHLALATLERGATLSRAAGVVVACIDVGGGWDAAGLNAVLSGSPGENLVRMVRLWFPRCERLVVEPGRSVVGASGVVYSRVMTDAHSGAVTVDASVAELPFPAGDQRPTYVFDRDEGWTALGQGDGTIFGGSTMETDVLVTSVDVDGLRRDDLIAFGDAGAYDVSLRTGFGRGAEPWHA